MSLMRMKRKKNKKSVTNEVKSLVLIVGDYHKHKQEVELHQSQNASFTPAADSAHTSVKAKYNNCQRLTPLPLPEFSGDYLLWPSFADRFTVVVHRNKNLTDVQRLDYL